MGEDLAATNVNRSHALAATNIAIFTFMLFFLYPRFENGRINPGVCGAGFIMAGRNRLACFGARDKGTCDNHHQA
jgi:hypothetical protein